MSIYRYIERIKTQIVDTERLLVLVKDHPLMSFSLEQKLEQLKIQLDNIPKEGFEPKIQLLFSGKAVIGSIGIKSSFVSKTVNPFQEMIKTQVSLVRYGKVAKRGRTKKSGNTDLYLTALPTGSFGIELSQLKQNDLFDSMDISNAIKQVVNIVTSAAEDDDTFENMISNVPKRNLNNLKKLLEEISEQNSILKMESNELSVNLNEQKVKEAFHRVSETNDDEIEEIITGIFRGILLDSGKFEIQDEKGETLTGLIGPDLTEEELISYDEHFFNKLCRIHLKIHKTTFKTGNERISYELLEIMPI